MHQACDAERDAPCNAYCDGDVHADLAYFQPWIAPPPSMEAMRRSFQRAADLQAEHDAGRYRLEVLSLTAAPEAPHVTLRYPTSHGVGAWTAYLVRYRLGTPTDAPVRVEGREGEEE